MLAPHLFLAGRRSWQLAGAALALALASAPPLALAIREPGYLNQLGAWSGSMAAERARHPLGPEQLALWASWVGALQPAALLALPGAVALWRSAPAPLARFAAIQIALLAVLAGYQDLVYGPRYLLVATPGLALAVARGLGPRRGVLAALLAVQLGGAWVVQRDEWRLHVLAGGYSATLDALPRGAV